MILAGPFQPKTFQEYGEERGAQSSSLSCTVHAPRSLGRVQGAWGMIPLAGCSWEGTASFYLSPRPRHTAQTHRTSRQTPKRTLLWVLFSALFPTMSKSPSWRGPGRGAKGPPV